VATLLNEDGEHFEPVLVSEMARLCRDHYIRLAQATREMAASEEVTA